MRLLKFFVIVVITIAGCGYGVYHFGTNFISTKVTEAITAEMDDDKKIEDIKVAVNSNPEIKEFILEGANVSEDKLLFDTKEEAINTIVKSVGVKQLQDIQSKYENGISVTEIEQLAKENEDKLTEDEISTIKAIAYKELYK